MARCLDERCELAAGHLILAHGKGLLYLHGMLRLLPIDPLLFRTLFDGPLPLRLSRTHSEWARGHDDHQRGSRVASGAETRSAHSRLRRRRLLSFLIALTVALWNLFE